MIKATAQQKQQVEEFFHLINHDINNLLLHPIMDEKTGVERLAICLGDRSTGDIYVLGLWFLPKDNLCKRFSFKSTDIVLTKKPAAWPWRMLCRMKKFVQLLWI